MRFSAAGGHAASLLRSGVRSFAVLFLAGLAAAPAGAACTCSVNASFAEPTVTVTGTSGGTCSATTYIRFTSSGLGGAQKDCAGSTSCNFTWSPSANCLSTGEHTVQALCHCANPNSSSSCAEDWGSATTTFTVNSTPTIGVSPSGPDVTGRVSLSMPYSFPNTASSASRDLYLNADGRTKLTASSQTVSGTWAPALDTSCWAQGTHELRAVAIACDASDPSYRADAFSSITVDHQPGVTLTLSPVDPAVPNGAQTVQVKYSFPQTLGSSQRDLKITAKPSGLSLTSFSPSNWDGVWKGTVSCSNGNNYLIVARVGACNTAWDEREMALPVCPPPPRENDCNQHASCRDCSGPGASVPVAGDGPSVDGSKARTGPGAHLSYLAGGAGSRTNPGDAAWKAVLGRGWSHDYAERLVPNSGHTQVWLITRYGSFRNYTFRNSQGLFEKVSPSDETRKLWKVSTGWELRDLDGTVQSFDSSGLWLRTRDRNGNTKTATYTSGLLTAVSIPDGRSETFTYHATGKLASITEVGVGGAAQRVWRYSWSGDDLITIDRPDGTGLRFIYDDPRLPGYMTRSILVGADDGDPSTPRPERIETAWEYDTRGNVIRAWKGSDDFATGIEGYEFAYDNLFEPSVTTVTIHRSDTEQEIVVYTLSRTASWVGAKARVVSISGNCSGCGLGPDSQFTYGDPNQPLRPTRIVDGRGVATDIDYDANGQVISRTEAAVNPVDSTPARETSWQYSATFPALPVRIDGPGPVGTIPTRRVRMTYDAAGNLVSRTAEGEESTYSGGSFSLTTTTQYNAAGQPLVIDPPGNSTEDQATFTYDPTRGNLLALTRTDPLIGSTTFGYDPFNRRVTTNDPNGLATVSAYDGLDRVVSVTQENLVTRHFYNAFGDLACTQKPRGNGTEFIYDTAGRLVEIRRKPDCDPAMQALERTVYTLNGWGQRVGEREEKWTGSDWEIRSETDFVYANRCQLTRVIRSRSTDPAVAASVTEYTYDCGGNLQKVWDGNHPRSANPPTQSYSYDALNRLASVSQPWNGPGANEAVTRYSYDVQDHLTSVTDAEGNVTAYSYSDRDLLVRQDSPVSGSTASQFDDHGELISETDARGVIMQREVDALDRVRRVDFPDDALDTTYSYDDPTVLYSKGRLTAITRPDSTIAYAYDRFGRLIQDGALNYGYDENGNRVELGYPDGVTARYGFDFADRETSLEIQEGSGPVQTLVADATYLPGGPLTHLTLGNGLEETRSFDLAYRPETIEVPGRLDQRYTTDAEGNILTIQRAVGTAQFLSSFDYQDPQYFLTRGDGPWGQQAWTYDRLGNRLSASRDLETSAWAYMANPSGGHTPKLSRVTPAPGGASGSFLDYLYDAAGDQIAVSQSIAEGSSRMSHLDYDANKRLSKLSSSDGTTSTELLYDGRGFLRHTRLTFTDSNDFEETVPTYSSEGLLLARQRQQRITSPGGAGTGVATSQETAEITNLFYFAGRPLAQKKRYSLGGGTDEILYLTTDHIGTPIMATGTTGERAWEGGLEPFGTPYLLTCEQPDGDSDSGAGLVGSCTPSKSMEDAGIFLRFPGQWEDLSFFSDGLGGGVYYNVHRWYEPGSGRYSQPDPISHSPAAFSPRMRLLPDNDYGYALQRPVVLTDPLGMVAGDPVTCVTRWISVGAALGASIGAAAGSSGGAAVGGAVCTPEAPVAGTVACGIAGGAAGGLLGSLQGAVQGAVGGAIFGTIACTCRSNDKKNDGVCEELLGHDQESCAKWWMRLRRSSRAYTACLGAAMRRYADCLKGTFPPRIPLSPSPFD